MSRPGVSVTILLLGRLLLGIGESFIITGGQSWALAILTVRNTSKADAMDLAHGTVNSFGRKTVARARQAEMFAQRRSFVVAPKQATAL